MDSPAPETEAQVARRALELIQSRLPATWTVAVDQDAVPEPKLRPDFVFRLTGPDGTSALLILEAKRSVERRDITRLSAQLDAYVEAATGLAYGVVAGRYLSPQVRAELEDRDIPYVDATGNIRIALSEPTIYLAERGSDRDPWRGAGRPRGTLKGEPAARVVRALLDWDKAWRVKELITAASTSVGATYRVLEYLDQESLITRVEGGKYIVPDWVRLLRAWSADYDVLRDNTMRRFIEPRGLNTFISRVETTRDFEYAVTGTLAARQWAPYAPATTAIVYVSNLERAAVEWQLRATDSAPNVLLVEPKDTAGFVFARSSSVESGATFAAPSQVAVDLMSGPGRNPAEAEELIRWMSGNPKLWRR